MNKYLRESALWIFIALPYLYLATVWKDLPEQVPTHFNLEGAPDDWSNKSAMIFIPAILGIGVYLLMLLIPVLDPKKRITQMGNKYYSLRLMLTIFFSILATYVVYVCHAGSVNPNMMLAIIGAFFAMLGNYFQTVRPNYFIGFRTPWTLENEQVWKKTHRLAGRLWIIGGLLIIILSLFISNKLIPTFFGVILFVMVIVPVVFSYSELKKLKYTESKITNR
ncbi:MAG TPA: SdpI family protein [Flavobacterium sp.]|jgi:uncharacterized membrane protein